MRCLAVFFIVFIFQSIYSYGQGNSFLTLFENKIQKADRYYQNQFYIEALDIYQRSLKKDTGSLSLKIKIAKCYKALQKYQDATQLYASIIKDSACKADERLNYVQLLILQGHMDQAKQEYLNYYRQIGDERSAKSVQAMEGLKGFYKDHLFYKVVPLSVNTTNEEFCPVYYDEGVVFISDRMDSPYIRKYTSTDGKYFCKAFYKKPGKSNVVNRELKIAGIANGNIGPVDFYKEEKEMVFSYNPEPSAKKKATRLGLYFASKDEKGE
ncbi:MAG TPA: tetratricopeptide repeat protein, partial [Cytophagaceae bacterium]